MQGILETDKPRAKGEARWGRMVGASQPMQGLFAAAREHAGSDLPVLIEGGRGTGKSLLAETLHEKSPRAGASFCRVDCASMPPSVIEHEVFGTEHAAGALECAKGGTLFLQHVDELPVGLQARVLEVLEQRARGASPSSFRLIVSTCRKLSLEVERGKFLSGLLGRLTGAHLIVPPLAARREDVPALINHFANDCSLSGDRLVDDGLLAAFAGHDWPGNVGELQGFVFRMADRVSVVSDSVHGVDDWAKGTRPAASTGFEEGKSYRDLKEDWNASFERRFLVWILRRAEGNISRAAREADMDRKYLHKLLKKHSLNATTT